MKTLVAWLALSASASAQVGIPAGLLGSGVKPLPACLLSGYPMNEGTGLTFIDVTGTANINMPAASLTWSTSNPGFSGIETAIATPSAGVGTFANDTNTNFSGTTPFSVSFWRGVGTGTATISTLNPSASYIGWEIDATPGIAPVVYLVNSISSNEIQVSSGTSLPATYPIYVAVTYDGSKTAAGVKIYLNGSALTTTVGEDNLTGSIASGVDAAWIGRIDGSATATGVWADLEIYNCVLSSGRVAANYALGPGIN